MAGFPETPIPFLPRHRQGDGLLPWVIGVMLFLCTLALLLGLSLSSGIRSWGAGLESALTVQIVAADAADADRQTEAVLRLLRATPGIASAEILPENDILDLLSPWLGDVPLDSGLTVPALIDIRLDNRTPVDTAALAERLQATAAGARLDDHKEWVTRLLDLARMVQMLLAGVAAMVLLSTVAIVIFGCRAGLATHRDSIEIMHLMGAEDSTIAYAFDRRYLIHGLKGGAAGVLAATAVLVLLSRLADNIGDGLVAAAAPSAPSVWWLIILPLFAGGLAMFTARLTVRRALSRMV